MIDKSKLLDPTSAGDQSNREKEVVADAQGAGKGMLSTDPTAGDENLTAERDTGGIIKQTVNSRAVAGFGQPGDALDVSGGVANLDETTEAPVEQNEYNR